ncbi:MAG: hypothetical protein EA427_11245, partial [Spirochaetaceae bacterium]
MKQSRLALCIVAAILTAVLLLFTAGCDNLFGSDDDDDVVDVENDFERDLPSGSTSDAWFANLLGRGEKDRPGPSYDGRHADFIGLYIDENDTARWVFYVDDEAGVFQFFGLAGAVTNLSDTEVTIALTHTWVGEDPGEHGPEGFEWGGMDWYSWIPPETPASIGFPIQDGKIVMGADSMNGNGETTDLYFKPVEFYQPQELVGTWESTEPESGLILNADGTMSGTWGEEPFGGLWEA